MPKRKKGRKKLGDDDEDDVAPPDVPTNEEQKEDGKLSKKEKRKLKAAKRKAEKKAQRERELAEMDELLAEDPDAKPKKKLTKKQLRRLKMKEEREARLKAAAATRRRLLDFPSDSSPYSSFSAAPSKASEGMSGRSSAASNLSIVAVSAPHVSSSSYEFFSWNAQSKFTKSTIISKGISAGRSSNAYRGLVKFGPGAEGARNFTQCDSLLIGDRCGAHTFPYIESKNKSAIVEHEATTSKVSDEQMFLCRQRGIDPEQAVSMIVNGFCKEVFKELPMEFAVEAGKLLEVSLEGSVG